MTWEVAYDASKAVALLGWAQSCARRTDSLAPREL
jgi:hypothetical protein